MKILCALFIFVALLFSQDIIETDKGSGTCRIVGIDSNYVSYFLMEGQKKPSRMEISKIKTAVLANGDVLIKNRRIVVSRDHILWKGRTQPPDKIRPDMGAISLRMISNNFNYSGVDMSLSFVSDHFNKYRGLLYKPIFSVGFLIDDWKEPNSGSYDYHSYYLSYLKGKIVIPRTKFKKCEINYYAGSALGYYLGNFEGIGYSLDAGIQMKIRRVSLDYGLLWHNTKPGIAQTISINLNTPERSHIVLVAVSAAIIGGIMIYSIDEGLRSGFHMSTGGSWI